MEFRVLKNGEAANNGEQVVTFLETKSRVFTCDKMAFYGSTSNTLVSMFEISCLKIS